jgi:8-oxo-dGTP diphosphatase
MKFLRQFYFQMPKNFHVAVKGIVFNDKEKIMLLKEPKGTWDLPGGRLEHGETFEQAIKRECQEEMGVNCALLDANPIISWPQYWPGRNTYVVYLCFPISLDSFDFIHSNECCGYDFFDAKTIETVNVIKALTPLKQWLKQRRK